MITIKIEGIEEKATEYGKVIKLKSDSKTYSFFTTKKDGGETKAYQQWQKFGFSVGDSVEAEVEEEKGEYQGKPFTRRKIMYFGETEDTPTKTGKSGREIIAGINERLDKLEKRVDDIEKDLNTPMSEKEPVDPLDEETEIPDLDTLEDDIDIDDLE